jgi:hypothetical protein
VASGTDGTVPKQPDEPVEYGVDVSFPIHYNYVSTNYPWLAHNVDTSVQSPRMYEDMEIQPLGDRQSFYNDYIGGCLEKFGARGSRCKQNELDRMSMSLRQPQSMQVRCKLVGNDVVLVIKISNLHLLLLLQCNANTLIRTTHLLVTKVS